MLLRIAGPAGRERAIECIPGQKLSEAIWLSDVVPPRSLCAGLGLCGRCRVCFPEQAPEPAPEDKQCLAPEEMARGWRLACHHLVPDCASLRLILPESSLAESPPIARASVCATATVGIDLGTTSIQWQAATSTNPAAAYGEMPNPQGGAGADVMSRLAYARQPGGLARLSKLARGGIARLLARLDGEGIAPERVCIAANSAMTEILLGCSVDGLAAAPYSLNFEGGCMVELELPGRARTIPAVIPPLPAPFIGGDITAGLLAVRDLPRPFLLADLGTNAEFALLDADSRLFLASAPLGPALEGIGPLCGQPAGPGVITGFQLGPEGLVPVFYDETMPEIAAGVSASGYLSVLAILLNLGLLSPGGHFTDPKTPLAAKIAAFDDQALLLPRGQRLTRADVELLLKVKAAFRLILDRLLLASGLSLQSVAAVCLGGALGSHVNVSDLASLGFVPCALTGKISLRGNTALQGACRLAANPAENDLLRSLCKNAVLINSADDPDFMHSYLAAMQWGSHAA